ncbi:MAG TPA: hypothetical protein GXZ89_06605 [Fastidiosipila sp.]|jgi:hypothetical protein|nr:hypothetical protein [Fastidiosipila sp.]
MSKEDSIIARATSTNIHIEGEVSVKRRGYIHINIDLMTRLFIYQDSNQWNNNFVRALTDKDVDTVTTYVANWPLDEAFEIPGNGLLHWQVQLKIGEDVLRYEGSRNSDAVWRHVTALIADIGGK